MRPLWSYTANGAVPLLRIGAQADVNGFILVDIKAIVTPALVAQIQGLGGIIKSSLPQFNAVRALIPLTQLEAVAAATNVSFIKAAERYKLRTGSVDSQGDVTHRAALARSTFGIDGTGVKVGVLSDSVDFLAESQATGNLGPVTILPGQSGVPGSGEGTAMLEIIHDLAPGAQLFFSTAGGSQASFANNILNLRAAGCDIIVDDVGFYAESPFQDGVIAQAITTVTGSGALYFSAAGNDGNLDSGASGTWEGNFVNGGTVTGTPVSARGGSLHSFGAVTFDTIVDPGQGIVNLLWSDPLAGSANDYDLYILDSGGANVVSGSINVQNGTQDPYEQAFPTNALEQVVIVATTGAAARFLHVGLVEGQLTNGTAGATVGHAASAGALGVAAVDVATAYPGAFTGGAANPVEYFSSDGPRRIFYDAVGNPLTPGNFLASGGVVLSKPDITAANGVVTSLPLNGGLNPFFGTSAAAPHAAAIAALIKSYNPNLTAGQISGILTNTALDIMAPGYDRDSGFGIVMAYQALQVTPPPAIVPKLLLVTNYVSGGNGNGVVDFDECNSLDLVLTNAGLANASGVQVTLTTATPGVVLVRRTAAFPNLPVGAAATNSVSFQVSTTPLFVCGTPIELTMTIKSDQITTTRFFTLNSGSPGIQTRFDSVALTPITGGNTNGVDSIIPVSGLSSALFHVSVGVTVTHPQDSDLSLQLIGPDGTTINLTRNNGGNGQNYGLDCTLDADRTVFDDGGTTPIGSGTAPFTGTFMPQEPLAAFTGKSGIAVDGSWRLHAVGATPGVNGTIQCWTLFLTPAQCTDGGGQCPGVDLAVGMKAGPNPVSVGANLTYTISVTNNGPDTAHVVGVNQLLPPGVTFISATASQGTVGQTNGTVSASVGDLFATTFATVVVVVQPNAPGTIASSVSAGSSDVDFDPSNNSAAVSTLVTPPPADLLVAMIANLNPIAAGGTLTYVVAVTNNGPSVATDVVVTNLLASSVNIQSVVVSQGSYSVAGRTVAASLGTMANGGFATITIAVTPVSPGQISATATVSSDQADFVPGNNTAAVFTTVNPGADLGLTLAVAPSSIILNSNLVFGITVTNRGPGAATGVAVNDNLPVGLKYVSSSGTQGTITHSGNFVTFNLGSLGVGGVASAAITTTGTNSGNFTNTATISATQADPNPADDSATVAVAVHPPFVSVVAAGSRLLAESFVPPNGAVDVGETVTLSLGLQNLGNVNNTNLVATLLATGGVTNVISGPQTYGVLTNSAFPVSRSFTFAAGGTNGGTLTVTLQLQDGVNSLGTATFAFPFPQVSSYANPADITINDDTAATPYPSQISVSGVTGLVGKVTVTLTNLNHTYPDDIGILLVGPAGGNVLLMSHCGDVPVSNLSLTFDDGAITNLAQSGTLGSGVFRPSQHGMAYPFPAGAPGPAYGTNFGVFNGSNPNGTWSLYVMDGATGDVGNIYGGWSLSVSGIIPINQAADLSVAGGSAPNPVKVTGNLTNSFTIANGGPNSANGVAFTNVLPANASLVSASSPGGNYATNAGSLIFNLGTMAPGSNAVVTVVLRPAAAGSLTNLTSVGANETDLNLANNALALVTTVNPTVADLGVSLAAAPNPAVVGQNLTYTITATNQGPDTALSVMVSDVLPAGLAYSAASSSNGPCTFANGTVTCNAGNLASGATAVVTIITVPGLAGSITNTAVVTTSANTTDPTPTNNSSTLVLPANVPAPNIVASSASLISESRIPANGSVDPGETVTVSLALANTGSADTVNLVATLLPVSGVTSPSGPKSYGALVHGGPAVAQNFTFTAAGGSGGQVTAMLGLADGAANLGTVSFVFPLTGTNTFTNGGYITIFESGPAGPYPSSIVVSGVTGLVSKATVTLSNLNHTFPSDIGILLVSPSGRKTVLMTGTGGGHAVTNVMLTFDDAAGSTLGPTDPDWLRCIYTRRQPAGLRVSAACARRAMHPASLGALNGGDPNGTWSLFVADDVVGDGGNIASGWSLSLSSVSPVNGAADLALTMSNPVNPPVAGGNFTYNMAVVNNGPAAANAVVVSNTLPAGLSFVGATAGGGFTSSGGTVVLNLGSIPVNGSANLTLTVSAAAPGIYTNSASVSAFETDLNSGDNQASAVTVVGGTAVPVLSAGTVHGDGSFTFTLTGAALQQYIIQASTDLIHWTPVNTNTTSAGGTFQFSDSTASAHQYQYYRAVSPTGP